MEKNVCASFDIYCKIKQKGQTHKAHILVNKARGKFAQQNYKYIYIWLV